MTDKYTCNYCGSNPDDCDCLEDMGICKGEFRAFFSELKKKNRELERKLDEYQTGEAQFDSEMRNDVLKEKIKKLENENSGMRTMLLEIHRFVELNAAAIKSWVEPF